MTQPPQSTHLRSVLCAAAMLVTLGACTEETQFPQIEYPDTRDAAWPKLVPTAQLAGSGPQTLTQDTSALADVSNRASALRARAANLRVVSVPRSRITRLRARARRLANSQF